MDKAMKALLKELYYQLRYELPIWLLWLLTTWWPNNRITIKMRGFLHRPFFKKCGQNLQMASGVRLLNTYNIEIGNDVYISYSAWLNGLGGIVIEDEVVIGPYVTISSLTHCYQNSSFRFGGARSAPVIIGRGSWLAAHASVSYGVTIGSGCLVAANAAVTKDVPAGSMVGGVPARIIKKCEEQEPTLLGPSWRWLK
ncbi:MAG TPA: acyltransferase [Anaerolineae bacterium]|nr:acyltransferase [Anaerolineae bacterium]